MSGRKSEDVTARACCDNGECSMWNIEVFIDGRYDANGDFEAHDDDNLLCDQCDSLLRIIWVDGDA